MGCHYLYNHLSSKSSEAISQAYTSFGSFTRICLGDGCRAKFCEDTQVGNQPLATQFPHLFNMALRHDTPVSEFNFDN